MIGPTIVDAGPIVALIDHRDFHHDWAEARFDELAPPLLTCESVLTEACFLLQKIHDGQRGVLDLVIQKALAVSFRLGDETIAVSALMDRYANVPMSLADACLVRMAEIHPNSRILTLDSDFRIYRKDGRTPIDAICPEVGP
jgi:predicted nucleic acid-binding protein